MLAPMAISLWAIHGSNPCVAVARALELKGLDHRVIELPPPFHAPIQRLAFGTRTVPAVRFEDGEKLSGSSAILRRLDELVPEPALFPADPAARARVQEAECWGERVWQPVARELLWPALALRPRAMASYQEGGRLPALPMPVMLALAPMATRVAMAMNATSPARARAVLAELPGHLDRIDAWLAEGVLRSPTAPNAADLQIASTTRLLMTIADARALIDGRPAAAHALALFPTQAGSVPAGVLTGA